MFVCGLHRSGTSVLARNIGRLENCTAFSNTGAIEDEGQHLQSVYPSDVVYGGTGRYGFNPRAHLTETSPLLTPENIARLRASWHAHWDTSKRICVEKTPGNLIMTRFLQAAFPYSYFIVVRRHPVPVSLATQRWKPSITSLNRLFAHWLRCHDLFEEDKQYLERVLELRYEDYVKDPGKYHKEIADFIDTRVLEGSMEEITDAHNNKYFDRWSDLLTNSRFRSYYRLVAAKYESKFGKYSYSLLTFPDSNQGRLGELSLAPNALGPIYFWGADAAALVWRIWSRSRWFVMRQLRARLPESLRSRLKHISRGSSSEKQPDQGQRPGRRSPRV